MASRHGVGKEDAFAAASAIFSSILFQRSAQAGKKKEKWDMEQTSLSPPPLPPCPACLSRLGSEHMGTWLHLFQLRD